MFWIFLFLLIFRLKSSNAVCSGIMKTIFVYDEYVCDKKVVCKEFLKQINFAKAFQAADNLTDYSNPFAVISSGYHMRQVIKFHTMDHIEEKLNDSIKDYFWSPQNLTNTLGLILTLVFRNGFRPPKSRSVVVIFTSTNEKKYDWELIQTLMYMVHRQNVQVFAVGTGTNIQEEVLKQLSSEPQKRNENYFLKFNQKILLQALRKERLESLYCSPVDYTLGDMPNYTTTEDSTVFQGHETSTSTEISTATTTSVTTIERSTFDTPTIFNSENSSFKATDSKMTTNSSWDYFTAEINELRPNLQSNVWIRIKRLSRIYGKYLMIGSLMGSIGAMAPYWTFCQSRPPPIEQINIK